MSGYKVNYRINDTSNKSHDSSDRESEIGIDSFQLPVWPIKESSLLMNLW